jgi:glycosyltransferase involved in cell wall biosynthesis
MFSLAICTYNPEPRLLERLIRAINNFLTEPLLDQVVIVDNNSSPAISSHIFVKELLLGSAKVRCVVETKQGLTFARCRAASEISSPFIVFFDDDNEPAANYLSILEYYFKKYPNVGCWGPGEIAVEYVDPVDPWFEQNREYFQQRKSDFAYGCVPAAWEPYYPNGTGLALRREVLQKYVLAVQQGDLRATDRKGKSLASGGDAQILWEGVKMGYAAGLIPELQCNHLIASSKANFGYLKRLRFGIASSYIATLVESFPSYLDKFGSLPSKKRVYANRVMFQINLLRYPRKARNYQLELADAIGYWYGHATVLESPRAEHFIALAKELELI